MSGSSPFNATISAELSCSDVITNRWWQNHLQTSKIYHSPSISFQGGQPWTMWSTDWWSISRRKELSGHHLMSHKYLSNPLFSRPIALMFFYECQVKTSREERSKSIFEKNELWCFSNRRIQPEHSGGNRLKIFQF